VAEVVEKRNIVAPWNASEEVKQQVRDAGGTVLPAPEHALRGPMEDGQVPAAPATSATTPVEGARTTYVSRGACQHTDASKRLHLTLNTAGGAMYASYCSKCGALGPAARGRVPSLATWMPPEDSKSRAPQPFVSEVDRVRPELGPSPEAWASRPESRPEDASSPRGAFRPEDATSPRGR